MNLNQLSQEEVDFIFKNGKRSSILFNFDFQSLIYSSYGFVKEVIPSAFITGDIERMIFKACKERGVHVFLSDISHLPVPEVMSFICWLKDELEAIVIMEGQHLSSEPEMDLKAAGIEELNQFGTLNVIDSLAGGDVLKWDAIRALPYHVVFDKQLKGIVEKGIEKRLIAIRESNNKNK